MYSATVMGPVAVILEVRCLSIDGTVRPSTEDKQRLFNIPVHSPTVLCACPKLQSSTERLRGGKGGNGVNERTQVLLLLITFSNVLILKELT